MRTEIWSILGQLVASLRDVNTTIAKKLLTLFEFHQVQELLPRMPENFIHICARQHFSFKYVYEQL